MSNIANFIAYRDLCPVCNNSLNFAFNYKNNKSLRFIGDELSVEMEVNNFPSNKKRFKINCIIDFNTNDFKIEFHDKANKYLNCTTVTRMADVKDHIDNKGIILYKDCGICKQYDYTSSYLRFDFKTAKLLPTIIWKERIYTIKKIKDNISRYELINNYADNRAYLSYDKRPKSDFYYLTDDVSSRSTPLRNHLDLPIVKISNESEIISRLETFTVFS